MNPSSFLAEGSVIIPQNGPRCLYFSRPPSPAFGQTRKVGFERDGMTIFPAGVNDEEPTLKGGKRERSGRQNRLVNPAAAGESVGPALWPLASGGADVAGELPERKDAARRLSLIERAGRRGAPGEADVSNPPRSADGQNGGQNWDDRNPGE